MFGVAVRVHVALALLSGSQRRQAALLLILTAIGMVLEMLGLGMVLPVMGLLAEDNLAANYPFMATPLVWLGNPSPARLAAMAMLTLVATHALRVAFLGYLSWRQMSFAMALQADIGERLFRGYLRQPYTFHLNRNSAELVHTAITEVRLFTFSVLLPAMVVLTEVAVVAGMVGLLVFIEPVGAIGTVTVMGVAGWVFLRVVRAGIDRRAVARQFNETQRQIHLQQGLGGVKEVKLLGRDAEFIASFCEHNNAAANVGRYQLTLQQLPRLWLEILAVAGLAGVVLSMIGLGRDLTEIVPTLGLFAAVAFRVMPSANRIMGAIQSLRFASPVIDVLHRELLLDAPLPAREIGGPIAFETTLELDHVSYTYPGASGPSLRDVSLSIPKGTSVGFLGSSGAGKSTLVDVVLGLLTPTSGAVRVDGRDVQEHLRSWQSHVGYVPQAIYLTDQTLRQNVAFGLPVDQIDEAAVRRAINAAQLESLVADLPEGLDTIVGERGVRLSGGQRQRIGIARALYHDPDVLVLDEATSALDGETESGVMDAVNALHGRKTVLIVAHRLSTIALCDRRYRMESGQIVEETVHAR
jgi:ABC-type multidrug transport system fused ATPase/permease subunit